MVRDQDIVTKSPKETERIGQELADTLNDRKARGRAQKALAVCLYGELGSGKTTFIRGFAKGLGVTGRLLSPTFIIVRRYVLSRWYEFFYHLDLYRVQNEKELEELGLSEIFSSPRSVVTIEWAEKLGKLIPKRRVDIHFTVLPNGIHKVSIEKIT